MLETVWSNPVCWPLKSELAPKSPVKSPFPTSRLCMKLARSGTPPALNGQVRPSRSLSQTALLSLPAAGGRLWGFLLLGLPFSFTYQREIPSFSGFIRASTRFLSTGTGYCYPPAGAVPVVRWTRKGVPGTALPREKRFFSCFC